MSEVRRVLLANGQYIEIVQETGTSTGSVMSQNAVTAALNWKANSSHTHAASDITSGTFSSARIADGAITSGKLAANAVVNATIVDSAVTSGKLASNSVTTAKVVDGAITRAKLADDVISSLPASSYETVIVTASSDYYTVNGLLVSINGVQYMFNSTGKIYAIVPYNQVYSVTPVSTNALQASGGGIYTASTGNRSITVSYKAKSGVYIEDKQGGLYTTADWSSGNNANANSVVLLSEECRFRIALAIKTGPMHSDDGHDMSWSSTLVSFSTSASAITDYDGQGNTQKILTLQPSTDYVAGKCASYIFPDGTTKGYLPAAGELYLVYQNKDAVDTALRKCGGHVFNVYTFVSSTHGPSNFRDTFWYCIFDNGNFNNDGYTLQYHFNARIFGNY